MGRRMRNSASRRRHSRQSGLDRNARLHNLLFQPGGNLQTREAGSVGLWRQDVFVGREIGPASAFDVAILTFGVSAMLGFLQGLVVWEGENLPAEGYLATIKG